MMFYERMLVCSRTADCFQQYPWNKESCDWVQNVIIWIMSHYPTMVIKINVIDAYCSVYWQIFFRTRERGIGEKIVEYTGDIYWGFWFINTQVFADLQWIPVMWGSIFGWITVVCTKQLYKFKEGRCYRINTWGFFWCTFLFQHLRNVHKF